MAAVVAIVGGVIAIAHLKRYEYIVLNWIFLGYDFLITCSHSTARRHKAAPGPCGNMAMWQRGNSAAMPAYSG